MAATMSQQAQPSMQRRPSYIVTPVLSPTDSIAFSDYLPSSEQPPYDNSLEDCSPHGYPIASHEVWSRPTGHNPDRYAVDTAPASYHQSSGPVYTQISTGEALPLASDQTATTFSAQAQPSSAAGLQSWYGLSTAEQQLRGIPLAQAPGSFASAVPAWQQQDVQPQLDPYHTSRQNPNTATGLANDPAGFDSLSEVSNSITHSHLPQSEQSHAHRFAGSSSLDLSQASAYIPVLPSNTDHSIFPTDSTSNLHESSACSSDFLGTPSSQDLQPDLVQSADHEPGTEGLVPPRRKRGRPKLNRDAQSSSTKPRSRQNRRQPHNEIERKYREGLNSEMERLREVVPTAASTRQLDETSSAASSSSQQQQPQPQPQPPPQKPTKAAVIKSAVLEIERLKEEQEGLRQALESVKRERDGYRHEVDVLRRQSG